MACCIMIFLCNSVKILIDYNEISNPVFILVNDNRKCRLCGGKDETINPIMSEYTKLTHQENKTRHDWVEKVIHKESCKKLKFDHTTI